MRGGTQPDDAMNSARLQISVVQGSILEVEAEVIVNAANTSLLRQCRFDPCHTR